MSRFHHDDDATAQQALLSVVIPAHNEEGSIAATLEALYEHLERAGIRHELLVVNDNSDDGTEERLVALQERLPTLRYVNNGPQRGFGMAVRCGLENFAGDRVAIVMADASDRPEDLVTYVRTMERTGADCVFGSRFLRASRVEGYPLFKRTLNRLANTFIRVLFGLRFNDTTNAFKLYRRSVIEGASPILSHHFNLTVELPLKAIVRGYSYEVVPIGWIGRKHGQSKLLLKEMGSRYLFIVLYCFLEKWLSAGDYRRENNRGPEGHPGADEAADSRSMP